MALFFAVGGGNDNGLKHAREKWSLTKEKILMTAGLVIIFGESISTTIFTKPFNFEIMLTGLALCGISLTQWGDKRNK